MDDNEILLEQVRKRIGETKKALDNAKTMGRLFGCSGNSLYGFCQKEYWAWYHALEEYNDLKQVQRES